MSVSLQKGQKVSLTKAKEGLSRIVLGLGWDKVKPAKFSFFSAKPQEIDCDASALMLQNGYFVGKQDIVYFGNLSPCRMHHLQMFSLILWVVFPFGL